MDNLKSFIIFVSIVLLVYGSVNFYIYKRVNHAAYLEGKSAILLKIVLFLVILSFPLGRTLGSNNALGAFFIWTGSFWLGIMSYGLLVIVFMDIIGLVDLLTGWLPAWTIKDKVLTNRVLLVFWSAVILFLIFAGHIRSRYVVIREHDVQLSNLNKDYDGYTFAVFADTHLGALNGEKWLNRLVGQINETGVDAVFVVGDLLDESANNLRWSVEPLKNITVTDGVWAVTGNHEFYDGIDLAVNLMKDAGMNVLRDEAVELGGLWLIGLDDITASRQFGFPMKPITELMSGNENNLPAVLLHHTPSRYREAESAGIDIMFSGHTHSGQMWPFGYLARLSYGVKQGWTQMQNMQFFLTNGAGTWGPPVRVGTTPELVVVRLSAGGDSSLRSE